MTHGSAANNFKDAAIDFTAGSLGGAAVVYVGQPLDTVKVKMQTFPSLYGGMINCFKQTLKSEGIIRGLYAGTVPALVANVAENSVLFACYGFCQKFMMTVTNTKRVEDLTTFSNAMSGFLAAFFSSFTLCPTELIKCKLQAMKEVQRMEVEAGRRVEYIGPLRLTRDVLRAEGVTGLFRGLGPTFMREMPGYFFFFGAYEGARELLRPPGTAKDDIGLVRTMAAGAVGGIALWTVIFPADVVKSRIQVASCRDGFNIVFLRILRNEGFLALYSGLLPTLVRTVPSTAALFVTYEYSKKFMHHLF